MKSPYDIAVIGGGASGLASAVSAARTLHEAHLGGRIGIFEATDRVGRPILKTGNGRCNFSNEQIARDIASCGYRHAEFVQEVFSALQLAFPSNEHPSDPVLDFFEGMGLAWRQEGEGRRYPLANKASVIVDIVRASAQRYGVEEITEACIVDIDVHEEQDVRFTLRCQDDRLFHARNIILAYGGSGKQACQLHNLPISPFMPVLGPLACTKESCATTRQLDNIRVKTIAKLMRPQGNSFEQIARAQGEGLFRSYGLSGICIFDLSRFAQPGDVVALDILQEGKQGAVRMLHDRVAVLGSTFEVVTYACLLRGLVLPRVADEVLRMAHIDEHEPVDEYGIDRLADLLSAMPFEVEGMGPAEQCQVQRGGCAVEALDPQTLEVDSLPGLYVVGEAVDVDGPCGGYNLHWAWGSGMLAGISAAGACT